MPEQVRAITLYQPYASLIVAGLKRFETRDWGTEWTGLLVIHAGKTLDVDTRNQRFMNHLIASDLGDWNKLPRGAALGVVEKGKCFKARSVIPHIDDRERAFGGFEGEKRVAWELSNPVPFAQPISISGKQGLWDWPMPLPDDVLAMFQHIA